MSWFTNLFARFRKVTQNVQAPVAAPTYVVPPVVAVPPAAPVVSAPVVSPVAPTVVITPPKYTGPFRDINGNPDPLGQYTDDNWQRARGDAIAEVTPQAGGLVSIDSITKWTPSTGDWTEEIRDTDYLWAVHIQRENGVFFRVLKGAPVDINRVINNGEFHYLWLTGKGVDVLGAYTGQLKGV